MATSTRSARATQKQHYENYQTMIKAVDQQVSLFKGLSSPMKRFEKLLDFRGVSGTQRATYMRRARRECLSYRRWLRCTPSKKRKPFRMMDLPGEIRNRIWEYAIWNPEEEYFFNAVDCPKIATVSRQVCREVLPAFFKFNDMHVVFQSKSSTGPAGLDFSPRTKDWMQTVCRTAYPGLSYEIFLSEVVKLKNLSITFLEDASDLTSPSYAEFRIDYSLKRQKPNQYLALTSRSLGRLLRNATVQRPDGVKSLLAQFQHLLIALQLERNKLAWSAFAKLRRQHPGGFSVVDLRQVAGNGRDTLLRLEHSYGVRMRQGLRRKCFHDPVAVLEHVWPLGENFKKILGQRLP